MVFAANSLVAAVTTNEDINGFTINQVMTNVPAPLNGLDVNSAFGADRFYDTGFTGQGAIVANIEPGHVWSGHETLRHVSSFSHHTQAWGSTTNDLFDRHATWIGSLIGGRKGSSNPGDHQQGIAPDSDLRSGAFASQWTGSAYTLAFSFTNNSFFTPFQANFGTADVINSSWAGLDPTGTSSFAVALDGLARTHPSTTYVVAAGNRGPGANTVGWPGSGYNAITVGALGGGNSFSTIASFSSRGPQDWARASGSGMVSAARSAVDISAPGQSLTVAYYGGQTGGNNATLSGSPSGGNEGPASYMHNLEGTSLASAVTAGAATLLNSASHNTLALSTNSASRDARVIKAVLLNSAEKLAGWNNGQLPNGVGGVDTTQALDYTFGAGRLDLDQAYDQYLLGHTDVAGTAVGNLGTVQGSGWDFGNVANGQSNDYFINLPLQGGTDLTASLTWFRNRSFNGSRGADLGQSNLNLTIFDASAGNVIARSHSQYNVVEHLSFQVPKTGFYGIRVEHVGNLFGNQSLEPYGLAWAGQTVVALPGDFNFDQIVDSLDIDLHRDAVSNLSTNSLFDLNGDQVVNSTDTSILITIILDTSFGDVNLDQRVDAVDLSVIRKNLGASGSGILPWHQGNIDGDGDIDQVDLASLRFQFGFDNVTANPPVEVPEPTCLILLWLAMAVLMDHRQRGNRYHQNLYDRKSILHGRNYA